MQRFHISGVNLGENFYLNKSHEIYYQLTKVLRAHVDDRVVFFDGERCIDFNYKISSISGSEVTFEYIQKIEKNSENNFKLSLYQAMPSKLSKLEYIVQKGVEVGYSEFIFFRSERSQKLVLSDKKIERLNKIITEAVEQSERNNIPKLTVQEKGELLKNNSDSELNIVFHTQDESSQNLRTLIKQEKNISIFVGPEGGFSASELEIFELQGYKKSYLGDRILRCETVGSVVGFFISQQLL